MTEFEQSLFASMLQLLPELLKVHSYSIYELAQELSNRMEEPLCEVITPLSATLQTLSSNGQVVYDRDHNQVTLAY